MIELLRWGKATTAHQAAEPEKHDESMGHNKSTGHYGKCHVCAEQMKPLETTVETQDNLIELAAQIYDGLTEEELNEVERLALDRSSFFDKPNS